MEVFKVYKQVYNYETERYEKEYLPDCFTSDHTANEVCELHKKLETKLNSNNTNFSL